MGKARLEVLEALRAARSEISCLRLGPAATDGAALGAQAFVSPVLPRTDASTSCLPWTGDRTAGSAQDATLQLSAEAGPGHATRSPASWSAAAHVDAVLGRARQGCETHDHVEQRTCIDRSGTGGDTLRWQVRGPLFASPARTEAERPRAASVTPGPDRARASDSTCSDLEHTMQGNHRSGAAEDERREWAREKQRMEALLAAETARAQREHALLVEERAEREKETAAMHARLDDLTRKLESQQRELCAATCPARTPDSAEFDAERIIRQARAQAEEVKIKYEAEMQQMKMAIQTKVAVREEAKAIASDAQRMRREAEEYLGKARRLLKEAEDKQRSTDLSISLSEKSHRDCHTPHCVAPPPNDLLETQRACMDRSGTRGEETFERERQEFQDEAIVQPIRTSSSCFGTSNSICSAPPATTECIASPVLVSEPSNERRASRGNDFGNSNASVGEPAQIRSPPCLSSPSPVKKVTEGCQSPGGCDTGGTGTACSLQHQFTTNVTALNAATENACTAAGQDASKAVPSVSAERAEGADAGPAAGEGGDGQRGENAQHISRAWSSESNFSLLSTASAVSDASISSLESARSSVRHAHSRSGSTTSSMLAARAKVGVGIYFQRPPNGDAGLQVKNVMKGSAAEKCGMVKVGDEIIAVDGQPVRGCSLAELANKILGASNTMVELSFRGCPPPGREGTWSAGETAAAGHAHNADDERVYTVSLQRGVCTAR